MAIGIGTDIIEVARMEGLSQRALERIFTERELEECVRHAVPAQRLASRFAAKEAVLKALGTGWAQGLGWHQIEVLANAQGAPKVALNGAAALRLETLGGTECLLSLSHEKSYAVAFAIIQ